MPVFSYLAYPVQMAKEELNNEWNNKFKQLNDTWEKRINQRLHNWNIQVQLELNMNQQTFEKDMRQRYLKRKKCKFGKLCMNLYSSPYYECKFLHTEEEHKLKICDKSFKSHPKTISQKTSPP